MSAEEIYSRIFLNDISRLDVFYYSILKFNEHELLLIDIDLFISNDVRTESYLFSFFKIWYVFVLNKCVIDDAMHANIKVVQSCLAYIIGWCHN